MFLLLWTSLTRTISCCCFICKRQKRQKMSRVKCLWSLNHVDAVTTESETVVWHLTSCCVSSLIHTSALKLRPRYARRKERRRPCLSFNSIQKCCWNVTLPSGPITALVVCVASMCSYSFGAVHVRLPRRTLCRTHLGVGYDVASTQTHELGLKQSSCERRPVIGPNVFELKTCWNTSSEQNASLRLVSRWRCGRTDSSTFSSGIVMMSVRGTLMSGLLV